MPTTVRELQSFFGNVNFNGYFIDEQTALIASLYNLIGARKNTKLVHLSAEHAQNFDEIKRSLCAFPQLANPNIEAPFTVYTNA